MSDVYDRMEGLVKLLGLEVENHSALSATLKGYAAGLEMIADDFKRLEKELEPANATGLAFSLLCNLFRIDAALPETEKREIIAERFKERFGDYTKGNIADALAAWNFESEVIVDAIMMNDSVSSDIKLLEKFSRILSDYQSPSTHVIFFGNGQDFDYWDATQFSFDKYDSLNLPFYILDDLL